MDMRLFTIAQEWASELSKFTDPDELKVVAQVTAWGFEEVERGRNPDTVLKEVLTKINEKNDANRPHVSLPGVQSPHRSPAFERKLGRRAAKLQRL